MAVGLLLMKRIDTEPQSKGINHCVNGFPASQRCMLKTILILHKTSKYNVADTILKREISLFAYLKVIIDELITIISNIIAFALADIISL